MSTNTKKTYYHYIVYGVTYEELVTVFMNLGIPVFKYCPGILVNDHYVAFQTTQQKQKQIDSMDPTKWIQTSKPYEWYAKHGYVYNEVVVGHTEYNENKSWIKSSIKWLRMLF